jgi:hypothetical protein
MLRTIKHRLDTVAAHMPPPAGALPLIIFLDRGPRPPDVAPDSERQLRLYYMNGEEKEAQKAHIARLRAARGPHDGPLIVLDMYYPPETREEVPQCEA